MSLKEKKKKEHFKHRSPRQGNTLKTSSNSSRKSEKPREVCVTGGIWVGEEQARKALGGGRRPALYWRPWQTVGHGEHPRCRKGKCSVLEAETSAAWMEHGGAARNSFL